MSTLVKICGVRTPEQALCAAEAGADLIGLVFYPPSHRCVTPDEAAAVVAALREAGARTRAVGLFVNEAPARINELAAEIGLAMVQLSGDEPANHLGEIELPLLRTVRLSPDDDAGQVREQLAHERMLAGGGDAGPLGQRLTFLIDAHVPGIYGGTGTRANWALAADIAREAPVLLAGGLSPDNVADAVRAVRPLGVDVSSGVETGRVKDLGKIRRFILAVREADVPAGLRLASTGASAGSAPPAPQSWGEQDAGRAHRPVTGSAPPAPQDWGEQGSGHALADGILPRLG